MKIAAGKRIVDRFGAAACDICPQIEWLVYEPPGNWSSAPEEMEIAVLIDDAYTAAFKDAVLNAPRLRWVHTENSGIDDPFYHKLLDRGICLTTSPGANSPAVAEFVFGLILSSVKRLDGYRSLQGQHRWQRLEMESLSDKTILVVGLGAIGSRVAPIAKAFGMHVLGIRRTDRLTAAVDELGTPDDLDEFLARADIVVLALPYLPSTHNLIGARQFLLMKEKVLLINIARGGIIDSAALQQALASRPAMQACLDVFCKEPLPAEDPLWNCPNLLITPHVAFCSPLFRPRAATLWLGNLGRFLEGKHLMHTAAKGSL